MDKKCLPCEGLDASAVLPIESVTQRLEQTLPLWSLQPIPGSDNQLISKSFVAKNFQAALDAINAMGAIAEVQGHHPDFHLTSYRNVRIDLFTHSLQGITENDLTLAELFDQVPVDYSPKWLKENPAATTLALNKSS
jgi:4a-hydroxytetrahydrobiopterin dehydratase